MNTGLGLNFLRFVNDEGSNGWAQVYARIPFDDVELKAKGALLGAVFGKDSKNWADTEAELTAWVDQYFNGSETTGNLAGFFGDFRGKYPDLFGVWIWITVGEDNKRELKLARWGEAGVTLLREGKEFDLTTNLEEGKIIRGSLKEGDGLTLWTPLPLTKGEAISDEDLVVEWTKSFKEQNVAVAGLIFKIGKLEEIEVMTDGEEAVVMLSPAEEVTIVDSSTEGVVVKEEVPQRDPEQELVGDQFVGPIGLKEKLWNKWRQLSTKKGEDFVIRKDTSKRKKWAGLLGVLFLILLVLSIITGSMKMKADGQAKAWRNFSEPIAQSMQEALDLSKINPSGAKKIMEGVKANFEAKKAEFANGKYKKELAELEKKINDGWVITSGEKESQVDEVVNMNLVRQGFGGSRMSLIKGSQFLVLDSLMGTALTADTKTKEVKVVAGKGEGLGWIDVSGDAKTVLIMTKKGVAVAGKEDNLITFDDAIINPVAMGRFGGNVYVLDRGNKEIFKYGAIGDGFGDRSRWLKQGQSISVDPVDIAIDSDVWVVGETGQVEKYRRGAREQFSLSGFPTGIKISRLAVELLGDKIGLLDTVDGMIVLCSKTTGNCSMQLKSEKLKQVTDLEFDETGNLLVLLSGVIAIVH